MMKSAKLWESLSKQGFSLIPLNGKVPVERNWQQWCEKKRPFRAEDFKGFNAGICCGVVSNLLAVDVDDEKLFAATCKAKGWNIPNTREHATGRGKPHFCFSYPTDGGAYGNRSFKKWGFDIRAQNGQVVAPGSIHPDTYKVYEVRRDLPLAAPPQWLLDLYEQPPIQQPAHGRHHGDVDSLPIKQSTKDLITHGAPKGERSEAIGRVLYVLVWSNLSDGQIFNVFESHPIGEKYHEKGRTKEKWLQGEINRARAKVTERAEPNGSKSGPTKGIKPAPRGRSLKELKSMFSAETTYIWRKHFPRGLSACVAGREGMGKTSICIQAGKEIEQENPQGSVVWLASEGAVQDTVVKMEALQVGPRFVVAQKGDGTFKWNLNSTYDQKELDVLLSSLEQPILAVFVDSIRGITPYGDSEDKIKNVIQGINSIVCDKFKASCIFIHHHKKGDAASLCDKLSGSTAISSSVRVVYAILSESALIRKIKQAKSNLPGVRPDLEAVKVGRQIVIREPDEPGEETVGQQAEEFLLGLFQHEGRIRASKVYEMGEKMGLSPTTLKNAKSKLKIIKSENSGVGTPWYWVCTPLLEISYSRGKSKKQGDVSTCNHTESHESHESHEDTRKITESHESHESQAEGWV